MKVRIGTIIESGKPLYLDIPVFIETRGLVVANSGGGKSYLMRVLDERLSAFVQCGVIAKTDEFSTLREKFDFLRLGDDKSEFPISYHVARLKKDSRENEKHNARELALEEDSRQAVERIVHLLIRSKQHFVVDISAIRDTEDRAGFVTAYLRALVDLPRKMWRSLLLEIDEVHLLCPELGNPVTKQAVVDAFSLTRKQGLCSVGATQRLSKFDKDAEAEANNYFVGRTVLDADLARSSAILGFGKSRWPELKHLEPGEWFVFGPAFGTKEVLKVRIDTAATTHPRAGRVIRARLKKPSQAMQKALRELIVLPAQVVERRETIEALHEQITKLERELKVANGKVVQRIEVREVEVKVEVPVISKAQERLLKRVDEGIAELRSSVESMKKQAEKIGSETSDLASTVAKISVAVRSASGSKSSLAAAKRPMLAPAPVRESPPKEPRAAAEPTGEVKAGAREMLRIACILGKADRFTICVLAGIVPGGGTASDYFAALKREGLVVEPARSVVEPTADGRKQWAEAGELTPFDELVEKSGLKAGARSMLDVLVQAGDGATLSRTEICEKAGIVPGGGTASDYFAAMKRRGFTEERQRGQMEMTKASRLALGWITE